MNVIMKGKFMGDDMEVQVSGAGLDLEFLFNGKLNKPLLTYVKYLMKELVPIAGTYVANNWYDSINVYHTLHDRFFDRTPEVVQVEGIDTMPYEPGVIY